MAKYIGTLSSDARGKVGGLVLTRGRNGTNIKSHAVPIRPNSQPQLRIRGQMGAAISAYRNLSSASIASWTAFALLYTWFNSLAQPYQPTGLQLYTQAYINAAAMETTPPDTWSGVPPVLNAIVSMTFDTSGYAIASDGSLSPVANWLLYLSGPIASSVNYVQTISRRFVGYDPTGAGVFWTPFWVAAFGYTPYVGMSVGCNAQAVDATTYISASPLRQRVTLVT